MRALMRNLDRGTRYLTQKDRATMTRTLIHPHLDYCQTALARPSKAARETMKRAYNYTARVVVHTSKGMWKRTVPRHRSAPALEKLNWPDWEDKIRATAAARAAKVWHEDTPPALRRLLPEAPILGTTRAATLQLLPEQTPGNQAGYKAFRYWAPQVQNETIIGLSKEATIAKIKDSGIESEESEIDGASDGSEPDQEEKAKKKGVSRVPSGDNRNSYTWKRNTDTRDRRNSRTNAVQF